MSPTTFFHLPRESRDQIYTLLVATTHQFQIYADTIITLIARCPGDNAMESYPSWLMANKAIQCEGFEHLQRTGGIELIIRKDAWWADNYYNTEIWGAFRPLQMRTLDVFIEPGQSNKQGSDSNLRGRRPYQVHVTAASYLSHLLNDISGMGALQVLTVSNSVVSCHSPTPKQVKIAIRSVLPQLRLFEYEIQFPSDPRDDSILENLDRHFKKMMTTKEMGELLLLDETPPELERVDQGRRGLGRRERLAVYVVEGGVDGNGGVGSRNDQTW
ncbi:hypothetical protein FB567DRAFT_596597 [Paraphoma chrysanthemicola]|uniref:Uncharacterized protein n=1 Tax=Paraphoma chrysanthemicola TaxID=798071 RepID=A0A8K0QZL6_9PLEO|nr:hypothetical protein FB567DRAFT_596597 [Paraphoma chrysanthemicola]